MCCYWNHLYCTTLSETLLSCQRIGHFLLQQMMLCELCAATGTIIYCTSLPQTLEFLRDLDTFCSRWCYVSCMCCCYWNKNLLHNISTTLWGSQIGHFCSKDNKQKVKIFIIFKTLANFGASKFQHYLEVFPLCSTYLLHDKNIILSSIYSMAKEKKT